MFEWLSGRSEIVSVTLSQSFSGTLLVFALLLIIVLTAMLYRRTPGMPRWLRVGLIGLRIIVLCLLLSLLLEPAFEVKRTHSTNKRLPVLIDISQSMSIVDQRKRDEDIVDAAMALGMTSFSKNADAKEVVRELDGKDRLQITKASRLDIAKSLITQSVNTTLKSLGHDLDIHYYAFGKSMQMLKHGQKGGMDSLTNLKAVESSTTIAESLQSLARTGRGAPVTGIVLLSDGLDTSLRKAEAAISDLGEYGIPIYTVPIGIADPDDVSIRTVIVQEVAFSGDKVPVRVQIKSKGYEKRTTGLQVKLNGRTVSQKSITLEGGLQFEDIYFHVDIYERGAAKVEVVIEAFKDEATSENNAVEKSIRVVNEKINILCMEGSARWEYRYLRAMLKRDPRFKTTFIATKAKKEMARNSSEYIERFPELREEAFKYDLVILGDVAADFFTNEELKLLEELIKDRGGSLLVLCGSRNTPTGYTGTVIEKMMPVQFDASAEWVDVDDSVYPVLTAEGRSSLVLTLETDSEKNDRIWSRVAPLDQLPPLHTPKPGATVLAELSDSSARNEPYPLVAWHRYGTGKCMSIATDRMWLLRFKLGDKYHWRVWSQSIQFLTLSRLMGEHKRIRLETDRTSYQNGERVLLYAHVLDDSFNPENRSGFQIELSLMEENSSMRNTLKLVPNFSKPGLYEGYFTPLKPGRYHIKANADDEEVSNTTEFQVANLNPEMANTDLQLETMKRIAEISGGKCLTINEFDTLSQIINREPHRSSVITDQPMWKDGWVAFLVIAFMGIEWILRRRYDLP